MKILLLEPNPMLARALLRGLGEERITVNLATDLSHAKRLADSRHFDVVVLDVPAQMQSAVLRYWRRMRIECPVLFLSMPGNDAEKFHDYLAPAAFLAKPFQFDDLLDQLRSLAGCDSDLRPHIVEIP